MKSELANKKIRISFHTLKLPSENPRTIFILSINMNDLPCLSFLFEKLHIYSQFIHQNVIHLLSTKITRIPYFNVSIFFNHNSQFISRV